MTQFLKTFCFSLALTVLFLISSPGRAHSEGATLTWWLTGSTLKVSDGASAPDDPKAPLHLYSARQEYSPFQIVLHGGNQQVTVTSVKVAAPTAYFLATVYREQFIPIQYVPPIPDIFTQARLQAPSLPDGLAALGDSLDVPAKGTVVLWVDLYVRSKTPPGDYPLTVSIGPGETRTVNVTVYAIDLGNTPSMSVIVPIEPNWTTTFYGPKAPRDFHNSVNKLLIDHDLVPGTFVARPRLTAKGWDFSPLDKELAAIPPGATFYAPSPYDGDNASFLIWNKFKAVYKSSAFDDPYFVSEVGDYYKALADYLQKHGRLKDALIYPADETRWVGDEPLHNGPTGFQQLAHWSQIAQQAGFRVSGSSVLPVAPGPNWPASPDLVTDTHVPVDVYDADPELFVNWAKTSGHSVSFYLNGYGDLIDMPAAIHRGLIWHAYARNVRTIIGYAALQWVDKKWALVNPWTQADSIFPQVGYGGGALVWPGPAPSIRLKLLREGVEDARLLDLYAKMTTPEQAQAFAACLTPLSLEDQNPPPDLWDRAHAALLEALTLNKLVDTDGLCLKPPTPQETTKVLDMDNMGNVARAWYTAGATVKIVPSPWKGSGNALFADFEDKAPEIGFTFGQQNWSGYSGLRFDVQSGSPYFTELNVSLTDGHGKYLMLHDGLVFVGPKETTTLQLPLVKPRNFDGDFDWAHISNIMLTVNTVSKQTDAYGVKQTYPLGPRALIFDNFALVK